MDLLSFIKLPGWNTTLGLSLSTWPDLLLLAYIPKMSRSGKDFKKRSHKSQDFEAGTFLVATMEKVFLLYKMLN